MISFLILRAGFPVMFVPVAVITIPFLVGLYAKDLILGVFSFLNMLLRNFWNFFEWRMPEEWFYGKKTITETGLIHYDDPTTFNHIWNFFADFRFPEHDVGSVPIVVWFIIFVAVIEFFVLIKLLKRAARQGQMPEPMSDLKALEAMKGRRYDD
ncbi:hypothetical protein LWH94_17445 [Marinobacter sp. G11]|uniref:hypothetical protein n=1 Tax=Marinobacter sp. G11 TaxID=2903522 RepID=UPI001E5BC3DF|nr:hypothetical protein [Marinobacter sp. G11]MCE0760967.1 hypothetical protein [Marinobacter sp. G11]